MSRMFPSKKQWRTWTLPNKLTCVGTYAGLIGLAATVVIAFWPSARDDSIPLSTDVAASSTGDNSPVFGVVHGNVTLNFHGSSVDEIVAAIDRRKYAVPPGGSRTETSSLSSGFTYGRAFLWSRTQGTIELGAIGGTGFSFATDVNEAGEVVGFSNNRAFLWKEGKGMIDLGTLKGGYSEARGINEKGEVVGLSDGHGFFWSRSTGMQDLGSCDVELTRAYDINADGLVVGDCSGSAFYWSSAKGIARFPGSICGARAVNSRGQMAGAKGRNPWLPILWDPTQGVVSLGSVAGSYESPGFALDLNEAGAVVGVTDWIGVEARAFKWTQVEGMTDIGNLGGRNAFALGINSRGTVVGWGDTPSGERRAFIWNEDTGIVDLLGVGSMAEAINDRGQVVGGLSGPPQAENL